MKNILLILMGVQLSILCVYGSSLNAKVDNTEIIKGNSVNLVLEVSGDNAKFPTIDKVGDYPIENISTMTKSAYKIINNKASQEVIKQQTIVFTPDKNMTIPSFAVEVDGKKLHSKPIDITIVNATAPTLNSTTPFNLKMIQSKNEVYVGEPVLLSIYFSVNSDIELMDFRSQQPQLQNFITKEIKGERNYQKDNYTIHEFRYLITPTQEGNVTIAPIQAKVAQRTQVRDNFFGTFFDKPKWSQIVSNELTLMVNPLPQNTDLVGDFTIAQKIDAKEIKANKPVNLTLTISGEGSLEDFDGLEYEMDGVTIYSDEATISSKLIDSKIISTYQKKFVFISDNNFTIPSKSLLVFNYKTKQSKKLSIDSYSIVVKGKTKVAPTVVQNNTHTTPIQQPIQTTQEKPYPKLWMLLLSFVLGGLATLATIKIIPLLSWKPNPIREDQALKILYPHINNSQEVEAMVRKLYAKKGGDRSVIIDKKELKILLEKYIEKG